MRKIIFIAAFVLAAVSATVAQTNRNLELGGSVQCSQQFREVGFVNVGADVRALVSVATWSRLRAIVGVNGFVPNGFDRYGYVLTGVTVDAMPLYVFADFGLNYNPSSKRAIGMAFDGGVGLNFDVAKHWSVYAELAVDRVSNGRRWQSTAAVKTGVMYAL